MGYGEKRDIGISYTGIYGFHLSCAFSAASLLFNLKRKFCLVPAPRGSPRSGVIEVFVLARRRGTLHQPRTPVSGAMAVGLKKNSGLTRGVLTKFRLAQAPRGSRFLRKPAPLRARRLRRPARRARRLKEALRSRSHALELRMIHRIVCAALCEKLVMTPMLNNASVAEHDYVVRVPYR